MSEWFPADSIGMLPKRAAQRWGDRLALVSGDQRLTYREFDGEVDRVAQALIASGVAPGEHVALWINNRPEFLSLFYAIIKIGAIAVPLNTRYRTVDLAKALADADVVMLFTITGSGPVDFAEMVGAVVHGDSATPAAALPLLREVVMVDSGEIAGACEWPDFLARAEGISPDVVDERAAAVDLESYAFLCYTSGTTSSPKGVMLGHKMIRLVVERAAVMGFQQNDVLLAYLPIFHSYGLGAVAMSAIVTGAAQILIDKFDADEVLATIERERGTVIFGFDTHYRELLRARDRAPDRDTSSLRLGMIGAGPEDIAPLVVEIQQFVPTVSCYGLSETSTANTMTFLDATLEQRSEASGYPLPGVEVRIVAPALGDQMPTGAVGEILVRSPYLMVGYYNRDSESREAIDADGWLHTGDMGYLRPDGYVRYLGRARDMLKVGGENVAPAEIEMLMREIPGVAEVAVIGVPDDRLLEVPAAFVVTDPATDLSADDVAAYFRGKIASYKIPREVFVVASLPATESGKVQKAQLRAQYKATHA